MLLDRWGQPLRIERTRPALGFRGGYVPADGDAVNGICAQGQVPRPLDVGEGWGGNDPPVAI